MMKTLEQINQEFLDEIAAEKTVRSEFDPTNMRSLDDIKTMTGIVRAESEPAPDKQDSGKSAIKKLSDVLFYVMIAFILVVTLVYGGKPHEGFHLFGYSGYTVLSGSMQSEIPEGSLVVTKIVDPSEIGIGDDITFLREDDLTVTHRVVSIIEDFHGSGSRGFQTQGIENPNPDDDIVYAGNIIGLVKFSIPELGYTLSYISEHIGIVFAMLGGTLVAAIALSKAFTKREEYEFRTA